MEREEAAADPLVAPGECGPPADSGAFRTMPGNTGPPACSPHPPGGLLPPAAPSAQLAANSLAASLLGALAGVGSLAAAVGVLVEGRYTGNWPIQALCGYLAAHGLIVLLLEGRCCRRTVAAHCRGLGWQSGRGLLYAAVGSLQALLEPWYSHAAGGYLGLVGLVLIVQGLTLWCQQRGLKRVLGKQYLAAAMGPLTEGELRELFRQMSGGDGGVDLAELGALSRRLGVELRGMHLAQAMAVLDEDGDGIVSESEFVDWLAGLIPGSDGPSVVASRAQVRRA